MNKKFAGFTPEQLGKIDPSLAGKQSDEQSAIIAANPALAARVGKMTLLAKKKIGMAYGGVVSKGFNEGGLASAQQALTDAQTKLQEAMAASQANPEDESLASAVTTAQAQVNSAQTRVAQAQQSDTNQLRGDMITNPSKYTTEAVVKTTTPAEQAEGLVDTKVGQTGATEDVATTTVDSAQTVGAAKEKAASTYEPLDATAGVTEIMNRLKTATGKVDAEALVEAQTMDPRQLAQLGLTAAQIEKAQTVQNAPTRTLQEGEMIEGSTVDMDRVKKETSFEAATGQPSSNATVQGQLAGLMEDFEGGTPPAWAAGALRAAASTMAARGISASSMAGQAIVQAAMESAVPIAQADAATFARFEQQNLSNRQQAAVLAAEQRAKFLGLEFTQEFQTRVANAAKISEIANINFTAEQQVALENARMAQSVDLANLSAANAKVLADSAALTQLDLTNLNNRQQAQVNNAKTFLQMDLQNLSNEQQNNIFKAQSLANALLSDQAATNASRQFNSASENQTNQFFSNLQAQIQQFNAEQTNSMAQFNAGQINTIAQFNALQRNQREQFNANNALVVAQANAQWAQAYTLADNAAQNAANRDAAQAANNLTSSAYNSLLQLERDNISYSFRSSESYAERQLKLMIASMQQETDFAKMQNDLNVTRGSGWGSVWASVAPEIANWIFS
jgi:hypothetical protein